MLPHIFLKWSKRAVQCLRQAWAVKIAISNADEMFIRYLSSVYRSFIVKVFTEIEKRDKLYCYFYQHNRALHYCINYKIKIISKFDLLLLPWPKSIAFKLYYRLGTQFSFYNLFCSFFVNDSEPRGVYKLWINCARAMFLEGYILIRIMIV